MSKYSLATLGLLMCLTFVGQAQIPFDTTPTWISGDVAGYATGAAWADINRDGWLDLVVANGNDMARQRVAVYYNTGSGSLPATPDWESGDIDYHGHLSVGDVNSDGYPDVAVSVYIGPTGFGQKGKVKLYENNGGTLSSFPVWVSSEPLYSFSCAFGDADGDGDLDLAVAGGESYYQHPEQNRIYYNNAGILELLPSWRSLSSGFSYDVSWADFDIDGDLDLVFADEYAPNCVFENYGDSIGTVPAWRSADASQFANSLFAGDVNGDGYPDLAVSDNNQIGGSGRFKLYLNEAGLLDTMPFWTSGSTGYGSGITLADIDNDDDRDLICGGWWESCRIFLNDSGVFSSMPQWTSTTNSVVEAMVFGDFDNDGIDTVSVELMSDGARRLYYLPRSPVMQIQTVLFGADTVSDGGYCFDLENGWISLSQIPDSGVAISVTAVVSHDLDLAVSNWDPGIGNYVFVNTSSTVFVADAEPDPATYRLSQNYPNPFNSSTSIGYYLPTGEGGREGTGVKAHVTLKVYDLLGREIAVLVDEEIVPGWHVAYFNARSVASGTYFYRLKADHFVETRKLVLTR